MLSIVIPAYNEEKLIGSCLAAFIGQKITQEFEIIVVDNNSTDNTINVIKQYKDTLPIRIVSQKLKGRGAARRKGFEEAKGEIILSTDADTIVPPNWITQLPQLLKKSGAVAITGTCRITDCDWLTNISFNFLQPATMSVFRLLMGHYWLSGFNFAIYKSAYEKSGGFSPKLNGLEDIDLSYSSINTL